MGVYRGGAFSPFSFLLVLQASPCIPLSGALTRGPFLTTWLLMVTTPSLQPTNHICTTGGQRILPECEIRPGCPMGPGTLMEQVKGQTNWPVLSSRSEIPRIIFS